MCLQEDSLMTVEAGQRYHLFIKRKLSTQDLVLEEVAQDKDSTQTINLEDRNISFKKQKKISLKEASSPRNKLVKQAKRRANKANEGMDD